MFRYLVLEVVLFLGWLGWICENKNDTLSICNPKGFYHYYVLLWNVVKLHGTIPAVVDCHWEDKILQEQWHLLL
jgi:hypothetical protein